MTQNSPKHNLPNSPLSEPENNPATEQQLQKLIVRMVDQDQTALAMLFDCMAGHVYGLALRILKQPQLAEEVVQETFWQAWRQSPRFNPERGSVKTWLLTIARSRALDLLRANQANECELLSEAQDPLPLELLAATQENNRVYQALMMLEPTVRNLVFLAFFRGLSHDEIANHAGLPLGTVKSHIRRALLTLRGYLANDVSE